MHVKSIVACCVSGILALSLVACGGQQPKEETTTAESAEVQKAEDDKQEETTKEAEKRAKKAAKKKAKKAKKKDDRQVIGAQDENATEVALSNGLEGTIVAVSIRVSGEELYGDNLLLEEDSIAANEEVRLFVAPAETEAASYDVLVKLDGQEGDVEFIGVPLAELSKATLRQEDGVAFVDYVTTDGEEGSTQDAAVARKQAVEEAAQLEEQLEEQYYAPEEVYYEPEEVYYEPEPVEAPSAPEQSEDSCAGDVVLRY